MSEEKTMKKTSQLFRLLVALAALVVSSLATAGTITYFHNDLAGSPVAATNASGQVIWKEKYRPYGERIVNSPASADNEVWFTSRRQDANAGLVYMGARYYDPVAGRFLSPDPSLFNENNVHSHNRYVYGNNNPNRYVDPDGRNPILIAMGIGALIGGGVNAISQYAATGTMRWQGIGGVIDAAGDGMLFGLAGVRSGAAATEASTAGAAEAKAAGTAAEAAKKAAIDANKLNHIFGLPEHNLEGVVAHYGSQEKAFEALKSATEIAVKASGTNGAFETTVQAGGANVTVRGVVIDGTVKIGTAFIP
jgi:RHS repeat-associated protein